MLRHAKCSAHCSLLITILWLSHTSTGLKLTTQDHFEIFFKSGSLEAKYNETITGFTLLCRYQHVIVNILIYCVTVTVMW